LKRGGSGWGSSSPEEFADFIKVEAQKWAKVIREHKLSVQK